VKCPPSRAISASTIRAPRRQRQASMDCASVRQIEYRRPSRRNHHRVRANTRCGAWRRGYSGGESAGDLVHGVGVDLDSKRGARPQSTFACGRPSGPALRSQSHAIAVILSFPGFDRFGLAFGRKSNDLLRQISIAELVGPRFSANELSATDRYHGVAW